MKYPEGTRLVVWLGGFAWNGRLLSGDMMQTDYGHQPFPVQVRCDTIVRESAAKCAERMLEMLKSVEQGKAINWTEIRALIDEAEGKDAQ